MVRERRKEMKVMEHNPLLSFEDGLEITYSDLKCREDGKDYITIYFERPNAEGFFDSAQLDFPGSDFEKIKGFSNEDLEGFRFYVERSGKTVLEFSREEAKATLP